MQVSDQIIKVLDDLSKKVGLSIDWTQQNIMPQVQDFMSRYIKYVTYKDIFYIVCCSVVFILSIIIAVKLYKKYKETDEDALIFLMMFPIIAGVISLFIFSDNVLDLIKINTIPEAQIIDYVKKLIQK